MEERVRRKRTGMEKIIKRKELRQLGGFAPRTRSNLETQRNGSAVDQFLCVSA